MLKSQIKVGGHYRMKVSGNVVTVRVDAINERENYKGRTTTVYACTNLSTGKQCRANSAQKFRSEVRSPAQQPLAKQPNRKPEPESELRTALGFNSEHEARTTAESEKREAEQRPDPIQPVHMGAQSQVAVEIARTGSPTTSSPFAQVLERAISDTSTTGAPHVEVQALAGTGKTTTAVEGIKEAKGIRSTLIPSPQQAEVWKAIVADRTATVRISSFSTKITDELKTRVSAFGLDRMGVEAKGIHSLGNAAVRKRFGNVSADKARWVVTDICLELLGKKDARMKDLRSDERDLINVLDQLASLCKQTMAGIQRADMISIPSEVLDELCSRYDIDLNGSRDRVLDLLPQVLHRCLTPRNGRDITFDDMIWLPLVHDLPIFRTDLQIVDEAQDLNRMQQELMYRAGHRIIFVGDVHQAIYGFAGADAESMDRMRMTLSNRHQYPGHGRGCVTLPLTVTRRCGKAIVKEAQRYVPEYEAHESNPEGLVSEAGYEEGPRNYRQHAKAGDFVLCRVNAPLVSQCFRFIKAGRKANIMGKKIGEGLTVLVDKSKARTTPDLISWLGDWLAKETANENAKRYPSEGRIENLQDRHDCVLAFCEGQSEVLGVKARIADVFTDNKDDRGISLASIHKSKGLEARRVFLLRPKGVGPRTDKMQAWELEQERNLQYVATTRAIEELTYCS